ncbi:EAL domain-containing protein [Motilibacter peucedani]|uniref:EAL domain-containing protein n=1 Tax=Motilibacter peucedani TaxID=598650 RepID=UPI0011C3D165|nr:EAL domain-containing protein [Motilibacter peucedani]
MLGTIVATAVALLVAFRVDRPHPDGPLATVLFTFAVLGSLVSGGLLWWRAAVVDSGRLGWLAAVYLADGLLLAVRTFSSTGGSERFPIPTGGQALSSVLTAYALAGGTLLAGRSAPFRALPRALAVAGVVGLGALLLASRNGLVTAYSASGHMDALLRLLWVAGTVLMVVAVWRFWTVVGSQVAVDWTLRWPLVSLVVALVSVVTRAVSLRLYDAAWWTAAAMQATTGVVLLVGLVIGSTRLLHQLEGFTEGLAVGLENEVRRAGSGDAVLLQDVDELADQPAGERPLRRSDDAVADLLSGRELEVVLQAVVDLRTGGVTGVEALSRISGPASSPAQFFADAAAAGVSREAELLAVRRALDLLPELPGTAWLALNVSPATAASPELAAVLRGHDRRRIVLELTEHAEVAEYDALVDALTRLRDAGVRVAVDDAGAGFSSFRHVVRLRPHIVKLDMSLIAGIDTDPVRRALVASLIGFVSTIGSTVIAEGIETRAELEVLTALGVRLGQGYLLGRPRPAPEALVVTLPDTDAARRLVRRP